MVIRFVLGGVYTAMAVGQLASLGDMPAILGSYGLVRGAAASVLAGLLIVGELVCGVWFLARPGSTAIAPVWVYAAVSLVWSGLALQAYARGLVVPNCGCFGNHLIQRLSWLVLLQDALTLVYAAVLVRASRTASAQERAGAEAGRDVRIP